MGVPVGDRRCRGLGALVLSLGLVSAIVVLTPAAGAGATTSASGSAELVYGDDGGQLVTLEGDGSKAPLDAPADAVGPMADLDDDGSLEVPHVDDGNLETVDASGQTRTLVQGDLKSKTVLAVGDGDGDGTPSVYYANASDSGYIYRVAVGGTPTRVADAAAAAVLGVVDFDGDGDRDIVYLGTSSTVKYYDGSVHSTGYSSIGSNNGLGAGPVADLNGDGTPRVPIVDGSQNIALVDASGDKTVLNSNYQAAAKAGVAAVDWNDDGQLEVVHIGADDDVLRYMTLSGESGDLTDASGSSISAAGSIGVAPVWTGADTSTPTPTPTASPTPSPTATPTPTPVPTPEPTPTATATPTPAPTASPDPAPSVRDFHASNPSELTIGVRFESNQRLSDIRVVVTGPSSATLTEADFSETGSGPYTYTTTTSVSSAGEYGVTLELAANANGNGASNEHEYVSVSSAASPTPTITAAASTTPVPTPGRTPTATPRRDEADPATTARTPTANESPAETRTAATTVTGTVAGERLAWRETGVPAGARVALVAPDESNTTLERVAFTPATEGTLDVSATTATEPPPSVAALGATRTATAVTYLQIAHRTETADGATVIVSIPRNRTDHPRAVALYRYAGGSWQRHDARLVATTSETYRFRADVPGLSTFAVGVREADGVVQSVTVPQRTVEPGVPLVVEAAVASETGTGVETVTLTLNGSVVAQQTVTLPADGTRTVRFTPVLTRAGTYPLVVGAHQAGTVTIGTPARCGFLCLLPTLTVAVLLSVGAAAVHQHREMDAETLFEELTER